MTKIYEIGSLITRELEREGPCTLETLACRLPACTWNQVFMAVDVLSREGTITLRPHRRFQYLVSLAAAHTQTLPHFEPGRGAAGVLQNASGLLGK